VPFQTYTINSYAGLNEDENPAALAPDQLREATNCCRLGNLTGTRPGLSRDTEYDADIDDSGSETVEGIYEYRRNRDEDRKLVVVAKGTIYQNDTTAVSQSGFSQAPTAGADNTWTFANFQNNLWAAGGAAGDDIWTWNGTGNATARLTGIFGSGGIHPKYVFSKFQTLFLGGFQNSGTNFYDNALCARYCDYASDATDPLSWPNSNTIPGELLGENPGGSSFGAEYNTGFGSYQDNSGDFLLFLTNRRILAFRENPSVTSNANRFIQSDAIATGCVSQNAFVDLGLDQGDAVYMSEHGIHSMALSQQFGDRENNFLSWPIRKTWETLNRSKLEKSMGAYWPEEGLILFAVPTGSSTYLNLILAMDIKGVTRLSPDTVRWYKWFVPSGVASLNYLTAARDPDGVPRIYVGGQEGEVAAFSRSSYSDLGTAIATAFRGKDEDVGFPTNSKAIGDAWLMVGGAGTYTPTLSYLTDDGRSVSSFHSLDVALPGFVLDNAAGNLSGASTLDNAAGNLPGAGALGSTFNLTRERVDGYGEGFTISHRFSHTGVNEPFFVGQISQEIAGNGISVEASAA
jgi:hypothetical protein